MADMNEKKSSLRTRDRDVGAMVEDIVKCKWSLTVLRLIEEGVTRPGAMERSVPGLTPKVLNERLRKMLRFQIVERRVFPVTPPRVEYRFTRFGRKFASLLGQIRRLQQAIDREAR
jgi:DNA-binding HxlR family transcriptional regulator